MNAKDFYRTLLNFSAKLFGVTFTKKADAKLRFHRKLDLKNPTTLADKLCYLELYVEDPLKTKCSDKYAVREYVAGKGLADILVPLCHDVCSDVSEIRFDRLPEQFVMKATHGCGMNFICPDKSKVSEEQVLRIAQKWLEEDYARACIEPHYQKIPHRIQFEELLQDEKGIVDYKIHCFHGVPDYILVCTSRESGIKYYLRTLDWEPLMVDSHHELGTERIPKPEKLDEMIEISKTLSADFDFVRVDLYEINGKVYFGELTFSPETGALPGYNEQFLVEKGKLLDIDGQVSGLNMNKKG